MAPRNSKSNKQTATKRASSAKVAAAAPKKPEDVIDLDGSDPDDLPGLAVHASASMGSGASFYPPSPALVKHCSPAAAAKPKGTGESKEGVSIAENLGIFFQKKTKSGSGNMSKDGILLICKLLDALVFRFQPVDASGRISSWSEKEMFQALRDGAEWVGQAGIDDMALPWCDRNEKMTNSKDHPIRLFVVHLQSGAKLPSDEAIIKLGKFICTNVNQMDGNETIASVPSSPFWPTNEVAVWSDIIGVDAAIRKLMKECGSLVPGFCDQHKEKLFTCFRKGELSMELARMIHAPMDEVHPDLRPIHARDCMENILAAEKKKDTNKKNDGDAMEEDTEFLFESEDEKA